MSKAADSSFDPESQWDETHEEALDGLVRMGAACGDDEELMRAKADRVCQMLREILEEPPALQITATLPPEFTDEQLEIVGAALKKAASAGLQAGTSRALEAFGEAMYDLCTSKLRHTPN